MKTCRAFATAGLVALAVSLAVPATARRSPTCSTRRRNFAAREQVVAASGREGGRPAGRRRAARTHRRLERRREELEAGARAGELGLDAVFFADSERGWAVGHDGVVLHSANGGESWQSSSTVARRTTCCSRRWKQRPGPPDSVDAKALLAEARRYKEQGADKPFLDVWFADAMNGYVVGAYSFIFRTPTAARRGSRGSIGWITPSSSISMPSGLPAMTSTSR
jgi:photosystem II stability/assembly factor-like uncharacterized protein